jgi:hypothetical protein
MAVCGEAADEASIGPGVPVRVVTAQLNTKQVKRPVVGMPMRRLPASAAQNPAQGQLC